jgi:hypothetical protein
MTAEHIDSSCAVIHAQLRGHATRDGVQRFIDGLLWILAVDVAELAALAAESRNIVLLIAAKRFLSPQENPS